MGGYEVEIRQVDATSPGVPVGSITFEHHLTERAQVKAEFLSGAHLLHLAVAGCLFNDILREAKNRGIGITDLRVVADGAFDDEGSTGITYAVNLTGDASLEDLRRLVSDCEDDATIPHALRRGADVRAGDLEIRSTG